MQNQYLQIFIIKKSKLSTINNNFGTDGTSYRKINDANYMSSTRNNNKIE